MYNDFMTYLFFSSDSERLNIYLDSFINKFFKDGEKNVVSFLASETSVDEIINECYQLSLAYNKKIVILKDAIFLKKETKFTKIKRNKILKNNNYDALKKYIINDNSEDVILILTYNGEDLDKDNIIYQAIDSKNKKLLTSLTDSDWPLYVRKYFEKKDLAVDEDAVNEIVLRSNGSLRNFISESEKLELYCNKKITLDDVKKIFIKPSEDDIFSLTKALLKNDKNKTIQIYRDLRITQNIEPITLISIMSNSLILISQIKFLMKQGNNIDEIANLLKVKRGKIFYTLQDSKKISVVAINKALNDLALLDKKIKHNEVDRFYAFEVFLLNFNA